MKKKILSFIMVLSVFNLSFFSMDDYGKVLAHNEQTNEIIALRTLNEKHFDNGDGTRTAYIDTSPLHFYENGRWVDIDNTLIKDENGNYSNAKNSFNVTLASVADIKCVDEVDDNYLASLSYDDYSISWDILRCDDCELGNSFDLLNSKSPIEINDSKNVSDFIDIDNKKIENIIKEYKESKVSHAAYKSLIDGCDVCFDIKPVSMQQSIILENKNVGQNKISFYVETNDLTACLCEDRSITFNNLDGDIIFIIPSPIMHDSGSDMIYHGNVDVSLVNYENGYIISYIPDREWILSEDRNYPVRISQGVYLYNNIYTYTLSMDYPNAYINNDTLEIGGNLAHKYDALITIPYNNILSSDYFTITDAKLYLYFNSCDNPDYQRPLRISALLGSYMPWWSGVPFDYVKELNRFEVSLSCYNDIDVTSIINSWKNYYCSSGNVGVYPYGLIIDSFYGFCSVYQADAASGTHAPFYAITYFADSNYNFTFSPTKYDDKVDTDDNNTNNDIYNFQKRMNCYSYALQVYDHSYVNGNDSHKLMPGELSLSINPQFSTVSQLGAYYHNINNGNDFIDFTEDQMFIDSLYMGTNLQKINLVNIEQFVLPNGYNENSQRIIAMNTGYSSPSNSKDYHFYVRHGNGSCSVHGGNCSIWSHKRSDLGVSSTIPKNINGQTLEITICDYNIAELAYNAHFSSETGTGGNYYNTRPRFYTIQQDLNVYNEWYIYNSTNDTTMYVY